MEIKQHTPGYFRSKKKLKQKLKSILRQTKMKTPKLKGCGKRSSKMEIYSNKCRHKEKRRISN